MEKFYWAPTREDRVGVCMGIFQVRTCPSSPAPCLGICLLCPRLLMCLLCAFEPQTKLVAQHASAAVPACMPHFSLPCILLRLLSQQA